MGNGGIIDRVERSRRGGAAGGALALHRRWLRGRRSAPLLLCPNLTVVALGTSRLMESPTTAAAASWLLLTGLFTTVFAIASLPATRKNDGNRSGALSPEAAKAKPLIPA